MPHACIQLYNCQKWRKPLCIHLLPVFRWYITQANQSHWSEWDLFLNSTQLTTDDWLNLDSIRWRHTASSYWCHVPGSENVFVFRNKRESQMPLLQGEQEYYNKKSGTRESHWTLFTSTIIPCIHVLASIYETEATVHVPKSKVHFFGFTKTAPFRL